MQLLDAVELYGFGNWELVSKHMKTRTPEGLFLFKILIMLVYHVFVEVRDEYISRYFDGNIGKATWSEPHIKRPKLIDHVPEDSGPLSPSVIAKLPPINITPEEAQQIDYKPNRDDFERVITVL